MNQEKTALVVGTVSFREGTKLWTCTKTGTDASLNAS
jgi:hypothetical protein